LRRQSPSKAGGPLADLKVTKMTMLNVKETSHLKSLRLNVPECIMGGADKVKPRG